MRLVAVVEWHGSQGARQQSAVVAIQKWSCRRVCNFRFSRDQIGRESLWGLRQGIRVLLGAARTHLGRFGWVRPRGHFA